MKGASMKQPSVGQVFTTKRGEKFFVEDVFSTHDPEDEDSSPDGFMVFLAPVGAGLDAFGEELLDVEFQEWCEANGVSY